MWIFLGFVSLYISLGLIYWKLRTPELSLLDPAWESPTCFLAHTLQQQERGLFRFSTGGGYSLSINDLSNTSLLRHLSYKGYFGLLVQKALLCLLTSTCNSTVIFLNILMPTSKFEQFLLNGVHVFAASNYVYDWCIG